ncbi:MAG: hypothetical protein EBW38_19890, partial [Rhodobacteraceae bacterium]|nr:hypothetical protein [Paracoccaceae bacterium]
ISIKEASLLPGLCIGATCAWHKDLMNIFGPIVERDTYEDLIFYFRAMILNKVSYVEKPLIYYRVGNGISQKKGGAIKKTGSKRNKNTVDIVW